MVFRYVGPKDIRDAAASGGGWPVRDTADLAAWLATLDRRERAEPMTFVVGADGVLRLAPRRSEHVACAGGGEVLAAGEMAFSGETVVEVTNQSTGYCPDVSCWAAVAAALDRAGIGRPDGFSVSVVFRRCEACGERNIVRDGDFVCAVCGAALPAEWNFG